MAHALALQWLNEVHTLGKQAFAKIEPLRERHVQTGIEYQLRASLVRGLAPYRVQQLRPNAVLAPRLCNHQIVYIDEPAVEQILQRTKARQADQFGAKRCPEHSIILINEEHEDPARKIKTRKKQEYT